MAETAELVYKVNADAHARSILRARRKFDEMFTTEVNARKRAEAARDEAVTKLDEARAEVAEKDREIAELRKQLAESQKA